LENKETNFVTTPTRDAVDLDCVDCDEVVGCTFVIELLFALLGLFVFGLALLLNTGDCLAFVLRVLELTDELFLAGNEVLFGDSD
jgi:hypothetical protein